MLPQIVKGDGRYKDNAIFWLTLALVITSVSFLGAAVFIVFSCVKRRRRRYQTVSEQDSKPPILSHPMSLLRSKRRNSSLEDRLEEEELQREFMIRKSYASRASLRTDTMRSESQLSQYSNSGDRGTNSGEHTDLGEGDGGKTWEAGLSKGTYNMPEDLPRTSIQDPVETDIGLQVSQVYTPAAIRHPRFVQQTVSNGPLTMIEEGDVEEAVPRQLVHRHST
ncbi:hypothetical protein LIA77_01279 [Sarocladium implicatum]|nr:hypothetical protein LIA77_01279 [Sarocladium implicatum]